MTRPIAGTLHVVCPLFNPRRYESHLRNQRRFAQHMLEQPEVHLHVIEMAYADREHELADFQHDRYSHYKVWGRSELWQKERLINLCVQRLPSDWSYLAVVDGDVQFARDDWAREALHALQHYDVVQPWSDCVDMGPHREHLQHHKSFCRQYVQGKTHPLAATYGSAEFWHPGYSWCYTRRAWDTFGGMIDTAILGAADHHQALALVGMADLSMPSGIHHSYRRNVMAWQDRAAALYRNLGFVEGHISHHWHGRKSTRFYEERWKILVEHQYDPDLDIRPNAQGVWELSPHRYELRDALRRYFLARRDDANSVD